MTHALYSLYGLSRACRVYTEAILFSCGSAIQAEVGEERIRRYG
jgi:hypothetical protein